MLGALTARRYRIGAWWGALYPLGTAIYFGLAAWGLLRLRSGRGVRVEGPCIPRLRLWYA